MKGMDNWDKNHCGSLIRYMEIIRYVYLCPKQKFRIDTLSLPVYRCIDGVERLWDDSVTGYWVPLNGVDEINTVALKSPIYLSKRNDNAVFEHWRKIILLSKNGYLEKIERLEKYLESLES